VTSSLLAALAPACRLENFEKLLTEKPKCLYFGDTKFPFKFQYSAG